jgi:hypothetical protein
MRNYGNVLDWVMKRKAVPKGNLYVYYGFRKLTPKAVKKPQLVVFFENANNNPSKNREWVERRMEIVTREGTISR